MKAIGRSGTVNKSGLKSTVLDPAISGKRVSISLDRFMANGFVADEGVRVRKCRLHHRFRQGLRRDAAGNVILTPMARATDNLVSAVLDGNFLQVHRATLDFYNARCREMVRELEKVAKVRNHRSAMLVGVAEYSDDMFCGTNYLDGRMSGLKPWEIGLSDRTMKKLGLKDGDHGILSRYPTTRVVPVDVTLVLHGSDDVVYLPIGSIRMGDQVTRLTDLLDGDLDGDQYVIRTVRGQKAKSELREAFLKLWSDVEKLPLDRTVLTWKDHVENHEDPEQVAYQKALSKAAVGSVTLDFYALFVHLMDRQSAGEETELTLEDVRQLMTDALESVFDLKHSNGADPMTLHALLLGMISFEDARDSLKKQGLDVVKLEKLAAVLGGRSVRDLASLNLPFAMMHGSVPFNAVQRFINTAPPYRPLLFIAALILAKRSPTPIAFDLVMHAMKFAKSLAQVYRDRLFPKR